MTLEWDPFLEQAEYRLEHAKRNRNIAAAAALALSMASAGGIYFALGGGPSGGEAFQRNVTERAFELAVDEARKAGDPEMAVELAKVRVFQGGQVTTAYNLSANRIDLAPFKVQAEQEIRSGYTSSMGIMGAFMGVCAALVSVSFLRDRKEMEEAKGIIAGIKAGKSPAL